MSEERWIGVSAQNTTLQNKKGYVLIRLNIKKKKECDLRIDSNRLSYEANLDHDVIQSIRILLYYPLLESYHPSHDFVSVRYKIKHLYIPYLVLSNLVMIWRDSNTRDSQQRL